jgi:hypothetical protein
MLANVDRVGSDCALVKYLEQLSRDDDRVSASFAGAMLAECGYFNKVRQVPCEVRLNDLTTLLGPRQSLTIAKRMSSHCLACDRSANCDIGRGVAGER